MLCSDRVHTKFGKYLIVTNVFKCGNVLEFKIYTFKINVMNKIWCFIYSITQLFTFHMQRGAGLTDKDAEMKSFFFSRSI